MPVIFGSSSEENTSFSDDDDAVAFGIPTPKDSDRVRVYVDNRC